MPTSPPKPSAGAARKPQDRGARLFQRDQRLLSIQLSDTIRRFDDTELRDTIMALYREAVDRREGDAAAGDRLAKMLSDASATQIDGVIRALSCYLDLINMAEDRQRIRVLRDREDRYHPDPIDQSVRAAVDNLAERGFTAEQVQALLNQLDIELVFTAHPTEAKRRTLRQTLRRLRDDMSELDRTDLLPRERAALLKRMRGDIGCLWETDTVRPRRPSVIDEVKRALYLTNSLWSVVPHIYRTMRDALHKAWPDATFDMPRFLRFGSWIGGDRDGHPFVTADVTRETLMLMRNAAINRHLQQCDEVKTILSISQRRHDIPQDVADAIRAARARWPEVDKRIEDLNPWEIYRHWLAVIRYRLTHTLDENPEAAYRHASELAADLKLIVAGLRAGGHDELADGRLTEWLDQVRVFGFHTGRLDIRQNSQVLTQTIDAITRQLGAATPYGQLDETARQQLLLTPPDTDAINNLDTDALPDAARDTLELFQMLHDIAASRGRDGFGALIVSMTHHASDALCMYWLLHVGAIRAGQTGKPLTLPIVPLFETIDDLAGAGELLEAMLAHETYRDHLAATGEAQICMVGYSDSIKDGGYLTANWKLYQAQSELTAVARRHGVRVTFFHGRGGALGRGGGPAARGILGLPPLSVQGGMRITEQGEVLADRYDDPRIAHRHLEQVIWATMMVTTSDSVGPDSQWVDAMHSASDAALGAYRGLVADDDFPAYFAAATPISGIEDLPIGSRPSRRSGRQHIADLRAIPYTFAWVQNRHMLTAFFGLGSGLDAVAEINPQLAQRMYAQWPFFRAVMDTAELALTKIDLDLGARYASLCADPGVGERLFGMVRDEYQTTHRRLLEASQHSDLLSEVPWLAESLERRNPWVDVLNFVQIEIMRRLAADADQPALADLHRSCIQGIASGMRTTG